MLVSYEFDERTPVTSTGELSMYLGTLNDPVLEQSFCSSVRSDQFSSSLITRSWYSTVSSESVNPSGLLWYSKVSLLSSFGTGTFAASSSSIGSNGVPALGPACGSVSSSSSGSMSGSGLFSLGFEDWEEVETGTSPPKWLRDEEPEGAII